MGTPGGLPNKMYVSMHFDYSVASGWAGETAQIGLRLGMVPTIGAPDMGALFTLPVASSVSGATEQGSDANWNYSCNWSAHWGENPTEATIDLTQQADMAADCLTFWNAIKTACNTGVRFVGVKLAPIQPDGTYSYGASEWRLKTPIGGIVSTGMPPETALAVSMIADVIGRRGRGRMFLPGLATTACTSYGKVGGGTITTVGAATKTLIDNLQNLSGVPQGYFPLVSVCSNNDTTAIRPQTVRVGNHFDVQRRRQHQVAENMTYTSL